MTKKEIEAIVESAAERATTKSEKRMQQYLGALKEDSDTKMQTVMEYVQDVPEIKRIVNLTLEKVAELTVDDEMLKDIVKNHEVKIKKLEAKQR